MLELSRDALKDHPLAPNLKLLVTHKKRANATQQTVVNGKRDCNTLTSIQMGAVAIYEQVKMLTAPLAAVAPPEFSDRLWLYRSEANRSLGEMKELGIASLHAALKSFPIRHNLRADDGTTLTVNLSRLRKTLANRLWRLSGGDPFAVARVMGHGGGVADVHYLAVTPELERNWKFMGESLVVEIRAGLSTIPIPAENTPVGRCKDPIHGERAPANGDKPCIDFLSCFGCRSYVITNDERDLYRLFSFYWFLIGERQNLGASKWSKVYGWIVRIIDTQVTFKFEPELISRVRERAKRDPHPYWRLPEITEAARAASDL
jgi:hypothetical protein